MNAPMVAPPPKRSCWFYGCISLAVFFLIAGIGGFLIVREGFKRLASAVETYTTTEPLKLEEVELPPQEMTNLMERVDAFNKSLDRRDEQRELVLTADEINALISQNPGLAGIIRIEITGDKITGKLSLPLSHLDIEALKGRYLNGESTFNLSLSDGQLRLFIEELTVNGKALPALIDGPIKDQDLLKDMKDPKARDAIAKFESIEVRDGRIICRGKGPGAGTAPNN